MVSSDYSYNLTLTPYNIQWREYKLTSIRSVDVGLLGSTTTLLMLSGREFTRSAWSRLAASGEGSGSGIG